MNVKRIHDGAGRELRLVSAPAMQTDANEMLYTVLDSAVGEAYRSARPAP
jgi:hypothetical protein